jgi:type I restriction enzyme S subunit
VPGTAYRQIGVKLWGEGAYEREPMDGGATKYAQLFRAEAGDVIVNKIWARNGSVAVVPDALAGC